MTERSSGGEVGSPADGSDPRLCPLCGTGRLGLRGGKFGAFVACSNYPDCKYTRRFGAEEGAAPAGGAGAQPAGEVKSVTAEETAEMLATENYLAGRALATVLFLSLKMKRPLFLEGEAGGPHRPRHQRRRR